MTDADFEELTLKALGSSTPRVWSFLVTMFGDLALAPEARLSGATVNALTAAIGIKPEATRVALHRLRKEGWIESHRSGRQTRYGLTSHGRSETKAAWPRVYGTSSSDHPVYFVLENPSEPVDQARFPQSAATVQIGPRSFVTTARATDEHQLHVPLDSNGPLPDWISEKLCPPELQSASQDLSRRFEYVLRRSDFGALSLLQLVALRVVVVHEWRRLILRSSAFPEYIMPHGWKGPDCRDAFATLLDHLPVPNLSTLDQDLETG
ncbi:PaaX family transcriptional regulator C-terminal domain-containing protein [Marivita sp. XM-24bin2]|uniref:PaaX family transcriptional regulator C-terminal domain-containing protein n=1 Tax=unclassified Marivita TaxID=2632480 RepID=UPI000D78DB63|nr:PaaX family transcriptional regulator C-terminal domain-containing protein [Marivita sp. XM-24bin2]MCR9108543.1 PaaX family transcriptional regulator [Paracoccaceae bacterium]PWL34721.1 MAG: PaaX family transcriptional regulator [Marivita sp. XM-24bin2]